MVKSVEVKVAKSRALEGEVISDKMQQTIVVKVIRTFKHPVLGKIIRETKNYKAHDAENLARVGDFVKINECRPLSKTKHMALSKVIRKAQV